MFEADSQDTSNSHLPLAVTGDNVILPFTLEMGQEVKRHKNLSAESDVDAEQFLKVHIPVLLLLLGL